VLPLGKKREIMPKSAGKFIQIATASTDESDALYALDADGSVWMFNFDDERWESLSSERFEVQS
jgi:hypothetical protein